MMVSHRTKGSRGRRLVVAQRRANIIWCTSEAKGCIMVTAGGKNQRMIRQTNDSEQHSDLEQCFSNFMQIPVTWGSC